MPKDAPCELLGGHLLKPNTIPRFDTIGQHQKTCQANNTYTAEEPMFAPLPDAHVPDEIGSKPHLSVQLVTTTAAQLHHYLGKTLDGKGLRLLNKAVPLLEQSL